MEGAENAPQLCCWGTEGSWVTKLWWEGLCTWNMNQHRAAFLSLVLRESGDSSERLGVLTGEIAVPFIFLLIQVAACPTIRFVLHLCILHPCRAKALTAQRHISFHFQDLVPCNTSITKYLYCGPTLISTETLSCGILSQLAASRVPYSSLAKAQHYLNLSLS